MAPVGALVRRLTAALLCSAHLVPFLQELSSPSSSHLNNQRLPSHSPHCRSPPPFLTLYDRIYFEALRHFETHKDVVESKVILEGLQRYGPTPLYLPVSYHILNAESAFFLQEANQDLMRNSSLQARTESFFIHQARQMPFVNASYGPLSVQQPVPLELLQTATGPFNTPPFATSSAPTSASSPPLFTFNWKVQTYIISERIHPSWPKVQVLFYIAGRDWDDYSAIHKLPCVRMFAFHETQEVRGTCRLKGELGICVAELEPLASWFSLPTVRPGRQRVSEQAQGTAVELYYMVQTTDSGDCSSEDSRKGGSVHPDQQRPMGYFAGHTPMQRIGSVRLFQPLSELKLDNNFVVMAPSKPIRQRETLSTFLALSTLSSVPIFTLRREFVPRPLVQAPYHTGGEACQRARCGDILSFLSIDQGELKTFVTTSSRL
ncbi:Transmembrane protein 132C [Liparis tanakae]|uniref:Transmembrane protein 132C n=1 Tax=Liparis tanakae TaxID=230148 RepID=A0A4Z2I1X5_9TELE|nr:Transmembrane protein 132C [Liparis tanakae]